MNLKSKTQKRNQRHSRRRTSKKQCGGYPFDIYNTTIVEILDALIKIANNYTSTLGGHKFRIEQNANLSNSKYIMMCLEILKYLLKKKNLSASEFKLYKICISIYHIIISPTEDYKIHQNITKKEQYMTHKTKNVYGSNQITIIKTFITENFVNAIISNYNTIFKKNVTKSSLNVTNIANQLRELRIKLYEDVLLKASQQNIYDRLIRSNTVPPTYNRLIRSQSTNPQTVQPQNKSTTSATSASEPYNQPNPPPTDPVYDIPTKIKDANKQSNKTKYLSMHIRNDPIYQDIEQQQPIANSNNNHILPLLPLSSLSPPKLPPKLPSRDNNSNHIYNTLGSVPPIQSLQSNIIPQSSVSNKAQKPPSKTETRGLIKRFFGRGNKTTKTERGNKSQKPPSTTKKIGLFKRFLGRGNRTKTKRGNKTKETTETLTTKNLTIEIQNIMKSSHIYYKQVARVIMRILILRDNYKNNETIVKQLIKDENLSKQPDAMEKMLYSLINNDKLYTDISNEYLKKTTLKNLFTEEELKKLFTEEELKKLPT